MRVWPYITTRVIEKIETMAPTQRISEVQAWPVRLRRITASPASCPAKAVHGWAPTAARATRI